MNEKNNQKVKMSKNKPNVALLMNATPIEIAKMLNSL